MFITSGRKGIFKHFRVLDIYFVSYFSLLLSSVVPVHIPVLSLSPCALSSVSAAQEEGKLVVAVGLFLPLVSS